MVGQSVLDRTEFVDGVCCWVSDTYGVPRLCLSESQLDRQRSLFRHQTKDFGPGPIRDLFLCRGGLDVEAVIRQ